MKLDQNKPPMRPRVLAIATGGAWAIVLATLAVWFLVSTDRWPGGDREAPAPTVFAVNAAVGDWLLSHGEAEVRAPPPPPRESLNEEEKAKVAARLKGLPPRTQLKVAGGMTSLQRRISALQAAAPGINVSVGGGGAGGGGGGGGGRRGGG